MKKLIICSLLIFLALLLDLGNPDALRQGTEGFYLQIAGEMFKYKSFLTPMYLDAPHWSKPPLMFQLPQILFFINGEGSLFLSRLSVLIFSILMTGIAALKIKKIANIESYVFVLFCFSSLGFYKYSRIFMMEAPLLLLGFLSAIYYFSYLETEKRSELILSVLFGALSCMVKGPVSIGMLGLSFLSYGIFHYLVFKKSYLLHLVIWSFFTILLSSGWFIQQYLEHGRDFYEYFFIRENLGKFSSKNYPMSSVFQGLFFYALPWSFLIPSFIIRLKEKGVEKLSSNNSKFFVFLILCFLCFFTVWLIPQQKSHHYALPAIPFLLLLINMEFFSKNNLSNRIRLFFGAYNSFFCLLGLILIGITFSLIKFFEHVSYLQLSIGALLLVSSVGLSFKKFENNYLNLFVSHLIVVLVFWSLFIPNYTLPVVPHSTKIKTRDYSEIGAVYRKPYFISQSIGREVEVLSPDKVENFLKKPNTAVIIDETFFKLLPDTSKYKILKEWPVWRRGLKAGEILKGIRTSTLNNLRSPMYLISF